MRVRWPAGAVTDTSPPGSQSYPGCTPPQRFGRPADRRGGAASDGRQPSSSTRTLARPASACRWLISYPGSRVVRRSTSQVRRLRAMCGATARRFRSLGSSYSMPNSRARAANAAMMPSFIAAALPKDDEVRGLSRGHVEELAPHPALAGLGVKRCRSRRGPADAGRRAVDFGVAVH